MPLLPSAVFSLDLIILRFLDDGLDGIELRYQVKGDDLDVHRRQRQFRITRQNQLQLAGHPFQRSQGLVGILLIEQLQGIPGLGYRGDRVGGDLLALFRGLLRCLRIHLWLDRFAHLGLFLRLVWQRSVLGKGRRRGNQAQTQQGGVKCLLVHDIHYHPLFAQLNGLFLTSAC